MDQSALLTSARAEFMRGFVEAVQRTLPRCIEGFFVKADDSFSSLEQGRFLDARTVLVERGEALIEQMTQSMDHLLARSFQTTYSTYRPTANFNTENLTLIDPTAFEGGLRQESITNRFRSEGADALRDLNIRVAIIFEQEVINERENPFRPYLFSRCIFSTFENFNINPVLVDILVENFAEHFSKFVSTIYTEVNGHLARHGVAAQLQLKIQKTPTAGGVSDLSQTEEGDEQPHFDHTYGKQRQMAGAARKSAPSAPSQIEQFFTSALSRASGLFGGGRAPSQASASQDQVRHGGGAETDASLMQQGGMTSEGHSGEPEGRSAFSWLKSGESVGERMRQFFRQGDGYRSASSESGPYDEANGEQAGLADSSAYARSDDGWSASSGHPGSLVSAEGKLHTAGLPSSIHRFQQTYTPSGAEMFDGAGGLRNLILEQRSALNELTSNVDEQMTIDIVAMLFEFILRDSQVPAEIRAQLGRLQFLVLKLALRDSSLLTQKGHPARLLVNRIGSISLGLKQIDPTGIEITKEICRIVETLLHDESEDAQPFSRMLDEFDAFIARELRACDKKTEEAVEGAEQARNRTLRFAHTSAQLHEALLGLKIDPYLQNFFETVWVYALEMADRDDPKRAHRFRLFVPDLLWSIIPKSSEEERMQLLALLPIILSTLKEGMASIQWNEAQQESLLNWLVAAHTKSMRIHQASPAVAYASLSSIHQHFNSFFADPDLENYAALKNGERSDVDKFLDDAIKELDIQVQLLDHVYVRELPKEEDDARTNDSNIDLVMEQLKTGVAVEINLGGEPSQGKLNWIDPALTNLILNLDGQEQPSLVSVRMFRRMIAHGRVKFLETEPLFERAVQSLLKSADIAEPAK